MRGGRPGPQTWVSVSFLLSFPIASNSFFFRLTPLSSPKDLILESTWNMERPLRGTLLTKDPGPLTTTEKRIRSFKFSHSASSKIK